MDPAMATNGSSTSTPAQQRASRKWLLYATVFALVVIGCVLVYRSMTGNTLRAQRLANEAEKAEKELAAKTPGSAEAFSALLARRQQDAEQAVLAEQRNRTNGKGQLADSAPAPLASGQGTVPGLSPGLLSGMANARNGGPSTSTRTETDVDAYAAQKEVAARESSKKMGAWEKDARSLAAVTGDAGTGLGDVLADADARALGRAIPVGTGQPSAAGVLDSYIKAQNQRPSLQSSDEKFLAAAKQEAPIAAPLTVQAGPGAHSVWEGTPISIAMLTSVSSDVAGPCRAQVAHDVYDSQSQSERLIPAGTRLVCIYNAEVVQGQERLNLAFTQMRFPNGATVALAGMQGTDAQGIVGAPAEVNTRFWRTFGSSFLIAGLARVAESSNQNANVTVNLSGAAGGAAAQALSDIAKQSLQRNLQIKPELRLSLGDRLNMVVTRDMVLDPKKTGVKQ